jgi:hypothetical protein
MGNQESKQQNGPIEISLDHPNFKKVKLFKEGKTQCMQIVKGIDEK